MMITPFRQKLIIIRQVLCTEAVVFDVVLAVVVVVVADVVVIAAVVVVVFGVDKVPIVAQGWDTVACFVVGMTVAVWVVFGGLDTDVEFWSRVININVELEVDFVVDGAVGWIEVIGVLSDLFFNSKCILNSALLKID